MEILIPLHIPTRNVGSGVTNTLGASKAGIKKLASSPRMPFKRDDHDAKKSREGKVPDNLYQRQKIAVSRYVCPALSV